MNTKYTVEYKHKVNELGSIWDYIIVRTEHYSVDEAITALETMPEVQKFLLESTLGTEYLEIQFNHSKDIRIQIPRYAI